MDINRNIKQENRGSRNVTDRVFNPRVLQKMRMEKELLITIKKNSETTVSG